MPTILDPKSLHALVQQQLENIPEHHTSAIVAAVDQDGAKVVLGAKRDLNGGWTLTAEAAYVHGWDGDNEVGAHVMLSF